MDFPSELNKEILLKMTAEDIEIQCSTIPWFIDVCNNIYFWLDWFAMRYIDIPRFVLKSGYDNILIEAKKVDSIIERVEREKERLINYRGGRPPIINIKPPKVRFIEYLNDNYSFDFSIIVNAFYESDSRSGTEIKISSKNNKFQLTRYQGREIVDETIITEEDVNKLLYKYYFFSPC